MLRKIVTTKLTPSNITPILRGGVWRRPHLTSRFLPRPMCRLSTIFLEIGWAVFALSC